MNNSSFTHPQTFSKQFQIGTSMFTVLMIVATIFGNSLVIAAFVTFVRLRTATNYFVVSLAATDLCVALFSMPIYVAYLVTGPSWKLGYILKRVWTIMDVLSGTASIANLVAISLDRCMCIDKPLMYYQYITSVRVQTTIAIIWLYSIAMSITSYFMWEYRIFNFVASIMYFWVPLLIIISAYSVVFRVALHQVRRISIASNIEQSFRKSLNSKYSFVREFKAAKTLAVVVGAFIVCWLPFVIINAIYTFCENDSCPPINVKHILITKWMHYGNSMLNPPIYGFMNKDFRVAFKHLLCCKQIAYRGEQFTENANGKARISPQVIEMENENRISGSNKA
ncbi:muscarinic acetylcholine receptor M5-like [Actinia tenebrosa]|uniref:Muscarinic acetylcholine receptor M5-like n=1 Tax=Actinia tenebrosa TaxID=6105 RepID=A0A6P8HUX4_ACTTE|nr:muscarinic acetylcholine receptor M5-like [Actinia tenebrosa]XP_031560219.1 muscarinic acetylcholine receptor M5-like [Actinia tenebrosa]XP_031560220.1 muscarinic acetylcholine receptor M5-like [Actinia tenebrosa]